ncbi:MAG: M15 family metallopeptidase [Hespellia sp.]|nr:M15 family metallopeptidase [Hespellia sp.]
MVKDKKRIVFALLGVCILATVLGLALYFGKKRTVSSQRAPIRMGVKSVDPVADSSDFVMLSDVDPDIKQEIRYDTTYNFMGKQMEGFDAPVAILTKESADALHKANEKLMRNGYCLKLYNAYCPKGTVDEMYRWSKDENHILNQKYFYPNLADKAAIFRDGYLSVNSAFSRGSTVAVTLVNLEDGKEVDMGSLFDYFDPVSFTNTADISAVQKDNRDYLEMIMKHCGFEHSGKVWWQFTLSDEPYPETYFEFSVDILTKEVYF